MSETEQTADAVAEEPVAEEPAAVAEAAEVAPAQDEPAAEADAPVEEPVAEEPVADEPVAEEPVAEEPAAEEPEVEEAVPDVPVAFEPPPGGRQAKILLCERGHRTAAIWSQPTVCHARPTRSGPECGRQLYPIGELPEQVQKALNPLKASKKASKG